ncbi:hypothetical protein FQA39_LY10564 [Lamprigera yunnana]|nr:hypothetical protein FQA39_LY10564 [Lamprigera yunnana]
MATAIESVLKNIRELRMKRGRLKAKITNFNKYLSISENWENICQLKFDNIQSKLVLLDVNIQNERLKIEESLYDVIAEATELISVEISIRNNSDLSVIAENNSENLEQTHSHNVNNEPKVEEPSHSVNLLVSTLETMHKHKHRGQALLPTAQILIKEALEFLKKFCNERDTKGNIEFQKNETEKQEDYEEQVSEKENREHDVDIPTITKETDDESSQSSVHHKGTKHKLPPKTNFAQQAAIKELIPTAQKKGAVGRRKLAVLHLYAPGSV